MNLSNPAGCVAAIACGAIASVLVASGAALAQTPAPQSVVVLPQPQSVVVLPKPECGAKPEHPGRDASETKQRQWRKDANAYLECFKKYAMDQRALAQQYQEAANAVIDEYNATVKELQAAADAAAASN